MHMYKNIMILYIYTYSYTYTVMYHFLSREPKYRTMQVRHCGLQKSMFHRRVEHLIRRVPMKYKPSSLMDKIRAHGFYISNKYTHEVMHLKPKRSEDERNQYVRRARPLRLKAKYDYPALYPEPIYIDTNDAYGPDRRTIKPGCYPKLEDLLNGDYDSDSSSDSDSDSDTEPWEAEADRQAEREQSYFVSRFGNANEPSTPPPRSIEDTIASNELVAIMEAQRSSGDAETDSGVLASVSLQAMLRLSPSTPPPRSIEDTIASNELVAIMEAERSSENAQADSGVLASVSLQALCLSPRTRKRSINGAEPECQQEAPESPTKRSRKQAQPRKIVRRRSAVDCSQPVFPEPQPEISYDHNMEADRNAQEDDDQENKENAPPAFADVTKFFEMNE